MHENAHAGPTTPARDQGPIDTSFMEHAMLQEKRVHAWRFTAMAMFVTLFVFCVFLVDMQRVVDDSRQHANRQITAYHNLSDEISRLSEERAQGRCEDGFRLSDVERMCSAIGGVSRYVCAGPGEVRWVRGLDTSSLDEHVPPAEEVLGKALATPVLTLNTDFSGWPDATWTTATWSQYTQPTSVSHHVVR